MKLYLSSYGIPDPQTFSEFVGKSLTDIRFGLVFNAKDHKPEEERQQKLSEALDYFGGMGCKVEQINLLDYVGKASELLAKFKQLDVLWFAGGNTYVLRWAVAKSNAEEAIKEALNSGVIYGGESAGAILAGPTLKHYEAADEPGAAPEAIYGALGLVNVAIVPHWGSEKYAQVLASIERGLKADGHTTIRLTDSEYLLVTDNEMAKGSVG